MEMLIDSGSGAAANVEPDVIAFGFVANLKRLLQLPRQSHHFIQCFRVGFRQVSNMRVGNDHGVTGSVRVEVQNDEIQTATMKDEVLAVA